MKKSIIRLFIGLMGFGFLASSCEDMLTPDLDRYATGFSGRDTVNFYAGILRNLQQVTEQNILLGELRGDLVKSTDFVTDSISDIIEFHHYANANGVSGQPEDGDNALLNRAAYYKVINQCNFYLDKVDSLASRNGDYYMRRETAQVLLIRAWTYMQLVQNYGQVPFITKPVSTSTTGWDKNPPAVATADNLLDLLGKDVQTAWSYCMSNGYPNYGNFNTGAQGANINHRLLNFDADVVYGDLYLLRGRDRSDFEKAAEYYFNYLYKNSRTQTAVIDVATVTESRRTVTPTYSITNTDWNTLACNSSYSFGSNEIVTGVPSAANDNFGLVLTRIPQIYGFDIHSIVSTDKNDGAADDASDDEKYQTSGRITLTPNYRHRQVQPSNAYHALNKAQLVIYPNPGKNGDEASEPVVYVDKKDVRSLYSAPKVKTEVGEKYFIAKFNGAQTVNDIDGIGYSFRFRHLIPLYRYRNIVLRYAEALNRAGFPCHAFAILRDGLNLTDKARLYPTVGVDTLVTVTEEGEDIVLRWGIDSLKTPQNSCYIDRDELKRAESVAYIRGIEEYQTRVACGIHNAGTGLHQNYTTAGRTEMKRDSVYNFRVQVAKRLLEEASVHSRSNADIDQYLADSANTISMRIARMYMDLEQGRTGSHEEIVTNSSTRRQVKRHIGEGDDEPQYDWLPVAEAKEAEMLAMELILADEYALETAFEGNRYYDLMRIARHLNTFDNNYGTEWLAWKIARRSLDVTTPYQQPAQLDMKLYNYLLQPENWYLQNPK